MANKDVFDILHDMGFIELYPQFEDFGTEQFASLTEEQIKEAVPENFLEEFTKEWKKIFEHPTNSKQIRTVISVGEHEGAEKRQRTHHFCMENVNLVSILKNTFQGKLLLKLQGCNKHLDQGQRKRLVHIIISNLLTQCERDFIEEDFSILSKKIVQLFPKESASVYFTPYISKKRSVTGVAKKPTGKLIYKYYNLKKLTKNIRLDVEERNDTVESENEYEVPLDLKKSIDWLTCNEEPWEEAQNHWQITFSYRQTKVENVYNKCISSAYQDWPILKTPKGYTLIHIDFQLGKFTNDNNINNFSNFFYKVLEVRALKKDDYFDSLQNLLRDEQTNEDDLTLIQIILLCNILPSTARTRQGPKKYWKPSCAETFDSIVTHVTAYGDIEKAKEARHLFAASKKITVQPFIIVVGENEHKVESTNLCIDNIEYEIPSLLEAVDVCFKSFHVFNAKYPVESEHIWQLLQIGLYKFRSKYDRTLINVNELLNDLDCDLLM